MNIFLIRTLCLETIKIVIIFILIFNKETIIILKLRLNTHNCWPYILFVITSFFFLLVFSSSTSPIFNNYGGDSAVFILLGKMFNSGKIPYVDFFDHKGPVLIFIQAIGIKLASDNRLSIFILQVISLSITQVFIYELARTYLSSLTSIGVVMLSLLVFSFTIQGGNSTEELSLPYLYLCLLITIRFNSYSPRMQNICFTIIGISAAILFWMRLNNMGVICACLILISIIVLRHKNRKQIHNLILWASVGFLAISAPIALYFIHTGAFHEMIYASFIFNMKYIQYNIESHPGTSTDIVKGWLSLLTLATGTILYYKTYKDYKMLVLCICLLLIGFITTHIGPKYFHYMTLNLPLFSLGIIQIFSTQKERLQNRYNNVIIFTTSLLLLSGYTFYKKNQKQYLKDQDDTLFIKNSIDIANKVPFNQKYLLFTYNVSDRFWLITDLIPNYKFFTKQEWHGVHDNNILRETNRMIQENPPLWIVMPNSDVFDKSPNPRFYDILSKGYEENSRNENLILYKAKSQ